MTIARLSGAAKMVNYIAILVGLILIWRTLVMSEALARLQAEMTENTDATNAVLTLVESLSAEIRLNAGDEAAMNTLADSLDANSAKLAAAVTGNTPAADPAAPAADLEPIAADPPVTDGDVPVDPNA